MKTTLFFASAMKAAFALAAVLILTSCSKDDDQPANTAIIDGEAIPLIGAGIDYKHLSEGTYEILFITAEKGSIYIMGNEEYHNGKTIDLTRKEPKHGRWHWSIEYRNSGTIFFTSGHPDYSHPVFKSGTLYMKRLDDTDEPPVFEIRIKNGKIKNKDGYKDGKEHTISLYYKGKLMFLPAFWNRK
ncbi:hypothetical protein [Bacteroides pyogenes]|uniref:hypothetical protein n=1 Tax=Bacteroides pyogenes TaxID=310300 RepID=UPI001BA568BE|nr:hypothetical protein [Bacteroides pyogenes]MBR8724983.1 hypothetical protein [Bacteroides pyogenes]MBR8738541.1 hypothetical protein [Bacteroides pyogenes]MBR8754213.1 hypothetical protein [Bacteroides pyogenes]MBR8795038.1 hypothetical protein [Bacteroides pyogenes]MBR8808930.1 hypothetical protein [Bacteroides pyogenes]